MHAHRPLLMVYGYRLDRFPRALSKPPLRPETANPTAPAPLFVPLRKERVQRVRTDNCSRSVFAGWMDSRAILQSRPSAPKSQIPQLPLFFLFPSIQLTPPHQGHVTYTSIHDLSDHISPQARYFPYSLRVASLIQVPSCLCTLGHIFSPPQYHLLYVLPVPDLRAMASSVLRTHGCFSGSMRLCCHVITKLRQKKTEAGTVYLRLHLTNYD